MSPLTISLSCFTGIALMLAWYISILPKKTFYRPIQPNEQISPQEGRDARKRHFKGTVIKLVTVFCVLCVLVNGGIWAFPTVTKVKAALNPTGTPTVTLTPTMRPTRTASPTPKITNTPRATSTAAAGGTPTNAVTPGRGSSTPTPKVVTNNVPVTVIVRQVETVIVNHSQNIPVTVVVYQTVVVPVTVVVTVTNTPESTLTPTHTPTMTVTPSPTLTETPTP